LFAFKKYFLIFASTKENSSYKDLFFLFKSHGDAVIFSLMKK